MVVLRLSWDAQGISWEALGVVLELLGATNVRTCTCTWKQTRARARVREAMFGPLGVVLGPLDALLGDERAYVRVCVEANARPCMCTWG